MALRRRSFQRPAGLLRYHKIFFIAAEGAKTEPQYFDMFNCFCADIQVKSLPNRHQSSPPQVLRRMLKHIKDNGLKKGDQAWIVADKDQWQDEQLDALHQWSQAEENFGFALSNPKFEYWLLLHFEDGSGISSSRECSERLRKYLPSYDKGIDANKLKDGVKDAIRRARQKDNPPCEDWPRSIGTTVYRLVQQILSVGT